MTFPQSPSSTSQFAPAVSAALDAGGAIIVDLPCRKCAYNLRALNINGRCPECGTAVGYSTQGDLLRFSDPDWVDKLRRGIKLILFGVLVIVFMIVINIILGVASAGTDVSKVVTTSMSLAAQLLMFIGSWLLTEPDPSGLGESEYGTARKVIRVTLLIGAISQLIDLVEEIISVPPATHAAIQLISGIAGLASIVGTFAQLQYLRKLAFRIPNDKLASRAQTIKWGLAVSYGVLIVAGVAAALAGRGGRGAGLAVSGCFAGIAGIAALVFGIMYLLLLDKLRREFHEQAAMARQTWASSTAPAPA